MNSATPALARPRHWVPLGLILALALAMTMPMLILYALGALGPFLVGDLGISVNDLGHAGTSAFGLAALLSPLAGPLAERLGARRGLAVLFGSTSLAYLAIAMTTGHGGIAAAAAICGIAQALSNPVTNLLIAERIPVASKAMVVGFKQAGVQIGALVAGVVLVPIAASHGWRAALGASAAAAILLMAASVAIVPPAPRRAPRAFAIDPPNRMLRQLMSVQMGSGIALSSFVTFLPVYATRHGWSATHAGAPVAWFGATGIASRMVLTPWTARMRDESSLLAMLLAVTAAAQLAVPVAADLLHAALWASAALVGLTAVATNAIAMSMVLRDASFGRPAAASAWLSAGFFAGFAIGPAAFGWCAATSAGLGGAFLLPAAAGSGALASLALRRARGERPA